MKSYAKSIAGAAAAGLMVLSFQNCSDFALQEQVLSEADIFGSQNALDATNIPRLTSSQNLIRWYKPGQPSYVDKTSLFFADSISFVVAFPRTSTGVVLNVTSGSGVDDSRIQVGNGKILAVHQTSPGNYSYVETNLPSAAGDVVVAASFGISADSITLLVNGVLQTATVKKVGVPGEYAYVKRGVEGNNTALEYVIYGAVNGEVSTLSAAELNSMSRYVANNNMIANVIFDPSVVNNGGTTETAVDPRFVAVKSMLDAKCTTCHNGSSGVSDYRNMTAAKAVSRNLVKQKDPLNSQLYFRLQGSMGSGTKDMPRTGSVSAAEVQQMYDWIANL